MSAEDQLEPVFGPDGQPDAATVAGLELDAFDAVTTARIRNRIRMSPQAQQTLAALDAVRDQLHSQPTPTMPEAVANRITAALHAEQLARAPQPRSDGEPPAATVPAGNVASLTEARERRSRRGRRLGLAAAGVAVIAAGGIVYAATAQNTTGGKGSNPPLAFGPHNSASSAGGHPAPDHATNAAPDLGELPEYSAGTLTGKLPDIVRDSRLGVSLPGNYGNGPDVATCTRTLGQQQHPIAVQHARFDRADAYIFVFSAGSDRRVKAYVVAPSCTGDPIYQTSGSY